MSTSRGKDRSARPSRELTCEDQRVWRVFVRHVTPLKEERTRGLNPEISHERNVKAGQTQSTRGSPTLKKGCRQPSSERERHRAPRHEPIKGADPLRIGCRPSGVDSATWSALVSGKIKPQFRLDLHGYSVQQAFDVLHDFLDEATARRLRCVEVITGLGGIDTIGAVRRELPHWLERDHLRQRILCVVYAQNKNLGAVRIYLKAQARLGDAASSHFR